MDTPNSNHSPRLEVTLRDVDFEREITTPSVLRKMLADVTPAPAVAAQEILVVEDNDDNGEIMQALLESQELRVTVVTNAADAVAYCKTCTPMMVLMDIGLPDMDGIQLTKQLKKESALSNVPFITVTAHGMDVMQKMATEAGSVDFITKPFKPADFLETVNKHLPGMGMATV